MRTLSLIYILYFFQGETRSQGSMNFTPVKVIIREELRLMIFMAPETIN